MSKPTYHQLHEYFTSIKFTELKFPSIVQSAIDVLGDDIPFKMKLFIAVNECGTLASNLGNPIRLNSKTMVTTNMQNIMFATSGGGKDQSVNVIRSNFKVAYATLLKKAGKEAITLAKELCAKKEKGKLDNWREYYKGNTRTLFPAVSTPEGMLNQMDILQHTSLLAYNMKIGELGSELKGNTKLMDNLKLMAEGYDTGTVPSSIVKTDELQVSEIQGLNINALMFSSIDTLLKDKTVRDRFVDYMTIQGSRRSMLYMNNTPEEVKEYDSLISLLNSKRISDDKFEKAAKTLEKQANMLIGIIPTGKNSFVDFKRAKGSSTLSDLDAREIYELYKHYNSFRSKSIPEKYKMKAIATKHLHWKALKLAGIFCMLNGKMEIETVHILQAISVVEYFNDDVRLFQIEVDKEVYERIVDYIRLRAVKGKISITKHTLIKEGFVSQGISEARMKELVELCTNSDSDGIYKYVKGKILYKGISVVKPPLSSVIPVADEAEEIREEKENTPTPINSTFNSDNSKPIKLSYKTYKLESGEPMEFDNPKDFKEYRNDNGAKGWKNVVTRFDQYLKLVDANVSMSPYHFGKGKNSKGEVIEGYKTLDTIISLSETIILDVDKSVLSIQDMHELLSDYTHIVSTTSDPDNLYKFRVILRLDREVELTPAQWKKFYRSIAELLGIDVDININKASMFHGYKGSIVYSNLNGKMIDVKPHMINAYNSQAREEIKAVTTQKQFEISYDNRFETFEKAYDCTRHRSLTMYSAMRTACKLGWTANWIEELLEEINDNWDRKLSSKRMYKVTSQIHKFLLR